jgi:hypothetical protein
MTKLIAALIVAAALFGIWELWVWYDRVEHEKEEDASKAKSAEVNGYSLPGLSGELEPQFQAAKNKGAEGLKTFLATYGSRIDDPRKAWIQLDYCVLISRENPAEAKRIFADVKARTPPTSKVWKRIQELSKSYE